MIEVQRKDQCPTSLQTRAPWFIFLFQETQRKDQSPTSPTKRLLGSSSRSSKKGAVSYKSKGSVLPLPTTILETSHLILKGQQDVVLSVSIQNLKPQCSQPFSKVSTVSRIHSRTLPDLCCRPNFGSLQTKI